MPMFSVNIFYDSPLNAPNQDFSIQTDMGSFFIVPGRDLRKSPNPHLIKKGNKVAEILRCQMEAGAG